MLQTGQLREDCLATKDGSSIDGRNEPQAHTLTSNNVKTYSILLKKPPTQEHGKSKSLTTKKQVEFRSYLSYYL